MRELKKEQKESQVSAVHHLVKGFEGIHEHWVAMHHFTLGMMEINGNNEISVTKDNDVSVELPQLLGTMGS